MFTDGTNSFHKKLRDDITQIENSKNVNVFTDKTNNIYGMLTSGHNKLLKKNVSKTSGKVQKSINLEAKSIATELKLSDRIKKIAEAPAYITLKDHKGNFLSEPFFRLINPSKN